MSSKILSLRDTLIAVTLNGLGSSKVVATTAPAKILVMEWKNYDLVYKIKNVKSNYKIIKKLIYTR